MNRKRAPEIHKSDTISIALPEKHLLDNGIPVYIITAGPQEVTKLEIVFKAGISSLFHQPGAPLLHTPLLPKFTAEMLTEGSANYTAEKVADIFDFYSVYIDKDCERDKVSITISCLNKHLEKVMPVVQDIILYPLFPQNEFRLLVSIKKQQFIQNNEKLNYVAKQKFKETLYGEEHPYGLITKTDDFDRLEPQMLADFHKCCYSPENCFILASGKPDDNLLALLNKYIGIPFGNSSALSSQFSALSTQPSAFSTQHSALSTQHSVLSSPNSVLSSQRSVLIEKTSAIQSAVRIGKVLFNYTHKDYYAFKILNTVLGGYFGSRLMSNIREDKGYTYGIGSNLISLYNSGYFFISSQIGVEYCRMAISEIYKEIKRLQEEKVNASELELVKNYILGSFLRSIDGPFALAEMSRILIEYNLDNNYFSDYTDRINSITPDEIMDTAQKYLQTDTMLELVVGKK